MLAKYCYLYWIRDNAHSDIKTQGYVGITVNPYQRFLYHAKSIGFTCKDFDANKSLFIIIDSNLSANCASLVERMLRPKVFIGWNQMTGGHYVPSKYTVISNRNDDSKSKKIYERIISKYSK